MSDGGQVIGTIIGGMIGFAIGGLAGAARGAALGYQLTAPREDASPSYSFSAAQNTKSQEIPVPIVYGENRVAGNIIFQKISESDDQKMDIQLAISEGPIESISDIKANDVDISSYSKIKLGERTQAADSINTNGETFPYLAYISASLDAGELELSGTPTITSITKGRKVDCWNGGGWTNKYTKNPVWCLYDFIKNERYSLGIKDSSIDIASFKSIAEYCDELVDGEPRFELDYVIDSKRPSLDHLQEILATFRSFIIYSGGELRLKVDGLENSVQSFDASNIVKGSFRYSKSSRKDMPNRVMVQYIDPDNHWAKAYAVYADDQDIRERGEVITKEVRLYGVQRFNQAGRMARYFQKQAKYCSTFCEFKAGIDSLQCEVGDVVTISHEVSGWVDKKFRIMEITEEQNDEMKISCREYHDAVYSDDGVVYQTKKDSTLPNPFEKPASVSNLNLVEHNEVLGDGTWIPGIKVTWTKPGEIFWKAGNVYISDDNGATWNFLQRVEGEKHIIKDLTPGSYKVKVVSENKRGVKEDFSTAPISSLTVIGKDVPPSDVTWGSCSFDKMIRLSWQPIPDVDRKFYEVRTDTNFGSKDSALVFRGDALSAELTPKQRSYTFYISAMDRSGNYSENASSITLTNSAPLAPPSPKVTEFFQSIWIEIEPVPDNDIEKYTVYITPSDGAGTPIGLVELKPVSTAPNKITYNAKPGESFLIQVSAWDVMGEGAKSSTVEASTKFVNAPDIPDGLLEESKLVSSLKSKINIAKSQSDDYANQVIAYPTEEDEDNQTTVNYKLKYSAGDIYVGTEVETDPNAFFDLTDQNDNELLDAEGNVVKVVDIRDENWAQLIGSGKATWHGGEGAESVSLVLSTVPANPQMRVSYGVKKMLKELAVDGLLKKGVTAKQIDANLVDALENMKGFAWNETVPAGMKLIDVASRITNNEGTLTSHQSSIAQNATDIQSAVTRVSSTENNIAANQTAIDQNADNIALNASEIQISKDGVAANSANIQLNANGIQQTVIDIESANERINKRSVAMPNNAMLFHFDDNLMSTRQVKPLESVTTLRPHEGKYGGAVAVEESAKNLLHGFSGVHSKAEDIPAPDNFSVAKRFTLTAEYGYVFINLNIPAQPNTAYTLTYYARLVSGEVAPGTQMYIGSDSQGTYGVVLKYLANDLSSSWQKFSITGTTDAAATELIRGSFRVQTNTNCVVEIADWQLEQKPFATSFVAGTRLAGRLSYPADTIDINGTTWHFVWKPQQDEGSMTSQQKSPKILSVGQYYHNNSFTLWHYKKNISLYIKGATNTGWSRAIQWNPPSGWYEQGKEYIFDVQIIDGNQFKVYLDGQLIIETTITDTFTGIAENKWTLGANCSQSPANALFDEVIVSPIAHSSEEIQSWYESEAPFYDSMQTELQASQVNQLANEFTVKIQQHANGKKVISGFGLATDKEGLSEFGVLADRFKIYGDLEDSEETATPIFVLDTESKKLYLLSDLIADGTITARMLASAELITESAQIKNGIIDDAKIANLEADKITTNRAKIKSAQIESIETSQIKVGGQTAKIVNPKPQGAKLWHFDRSLVSTNGVKPIEAIATLRPGEGKFGGAVSVDEGTTNLLSNPNFEKDYSWWRTSAGGMIENVGGISGNWRGRIRARGDATDHNRIYQEKIRIFSSNKYTFSTYAKKISGSDELNLIIAWYKRGLFPFNPPIYLRQDSYRTNIDNTWKRYAFTPSVPSDAYYAYVYLYVSKTSILDVVFDDVQFEAKPFPTSFAEDDREHGRLKYDPVDIGLNLQEGTFSCWFRPSAGFFSSSWSRIMGQATSVNKNEIELMRLDNTKKLAFAISNSNGNPQTSWENVQSSMELEADKWYHVAGVWSVSQGYYAIYINGVEESRKNLISHFTPSILGEIGIGCHPSYSSRVANSLFDEVLVSPIAHTPEEIKSWYESQAQFFDNETQIFAGESTVINENGIITTDEAGNRSELNSGHLAFYEAGNPDPWWYTHRVVRGEVEDGTFVEVPWWTPRTKIIVAAKNLLTFNPEFPDNVQMHHTEAEFAEVNGVPGYWLYAKAVVPQGYNGPMKENKWIPYGGYLETPHTSPQTAKIGFCVEIIIRCVNDNPVQYSRVYLVRASDNKVIDDKSVKNYLSGQYHNGVFDNLVPDTYYLKYTSTAANHFYFKSWEEWSYRVVHGSDVLLPEGVSKPMVTYIIIEGGQ